MSLLRGNIKAVAYMSIEVDALWTFVMKLVGGKIKLNRQNGLAVAPVCKYRRDKRHLPELAR
jgi:hypothetical protein